MGQLLGAAVRACPVFFLKNNKQKVQEDTSACCCCAAAARRDCCNKIPVPIKTLGSSSKKGADEEVHEEIC